MGFLGLGLNDKVLDAKTLWDFENTLANADMGEKLFCMFDEILENEVHFGYKNHVKCDAESKLITNYAVTDAALHDSNRCIDLLEGCRNCICEKDYRIEHIFGFMTCSMHGISIRSIGLNRAWLNIGLMNLIYNIFRYEFLKRTTA